MKKNVCNIFMGLDSNANQKDIVFMKNYIASFDIFEVGRMDASDDVNEISNAIKGKQYDILICRDILRQKPVGGGTIKLWRDIDPELKIILVVADDRRSGDKLRNLYERDYYDALYLSDFANTKVHPAPLASLILEGRTKEEAFVYYGLADNVHYDDTPAGNAGSMETAGQNLMTEHEFVRQPDGTAQEKEYQPDVRGNQTAGRQRTVSEEMSRVFNQQSAGMPEYRQQPVDNPYRAGNAYDSSNGFDGFPNGNQTQDRTASQMPSTPPSGSVVPDSRGSMGMVPPPVCGEKYWESHEMPGHQSQAEDIKAVLGGSAGRPQNYAARPEEKMRYMEPSARPQMPEPRYAAMQNSVNAIMESSVVPHEGYIVAAVSDSALIVEIPGAHFFSDKERLPRTAVNLIMPGF